MNEYCDEISAGFRERRIWSRLASMAIDTQYKQNTLGPLWISANTAVLILAFSVVYGQMLQVELWDHLLYVAAGLICWYFYSSVIVKGCSAFIVSKQLILQLPLPVSVHIYKLVYQELIIFGYNFLVLLLVLLISMHGVSFITLMVIPAFFLIVINAYLVSFMFAIVATRYRDVASTTQAVIAPMMFLTPIVWRSADIESRPLFVTLNPFFHIIEIWRSPILGSPIPVQSWLFVVCFTLFLFLFGSVLMRKYRDRIAFWL